jgi:hypothetical protein
MTIGTAFGRIAGVSAAKSVGLKAELNDAAA